jgi:aspartate aminotransferase
MPSISKRAQRIPASPIRRLVPFADQAKSRGIHVHHLNIGQPDIQTPTVMMDAFRNFDDRVLAYGPSAGLPELRAAVANYFCRVGDPVKPEQVFVTTGGSEALVFAFAAVADHGDEILVPEPFYANYNGFATLLGIQVKPITTRADNGFHLPSDEEIAAAIGPKTKAIALANPGNPTGTVYTPEEMERLARLIEAKDLYLISDEVYREFVYEGAQFKSALSLDCAPQRVIVTDSISKRFSACGARIGFAVTKNEALADAFTRMGFARLCPATVAQRAAIAAYQLDPTYFDPVIEEYQKRRDVLVDGLEAIEGVGTYRPEGAFYTVINLPVDDADRFCQWLLTDFSHDGETVMMAPASGFYASEGLGKQEARIAYVLHAEALKRSVNILAAALVEYPGRL